MKPGACRAQQRPAVTETGIAPETPDLAKNIPTWFNTQERIELLLNRAQFWMGTPWRPNSCHPGRNGGVSCQKLCAAIYAECGWRKIEAPEVAMAHAQFAQGESILASFMDKCDAFARVEGGEDWNKLLPGDLIGMQMFQVIHHAGIYLGDGNFVHAMDQIGTRISSGHDGTWLTRLKAAWRPLP